MGVLAFLAITIISFNSAAQTERQTDNDEEPKIIKKNKLKSTLGYQIYAGANYNSNVAVNELDVNVGTGDILAKTDAKIKFETDIGDNSEFSIQYRLASSTHQKLSRFDILSNTVLAKFEHDFAGFKAGIRYQFADYNLNQNDFLTLNHIRPYIAKRISKKTYIRGYYGYSDKKYQNAIARTAKENRLGADTYYFINGSRQYIQAGYFYKDSNANGDEFDFGSHNFKLGYVKRFKFNNRRARLKLGWRYEMRDYKNITPLIGVKRDDDRHRFRADFRIPVNDIIYGQFEAGYANYSSNLPSADYSRNIVAVGIGAKF